MGEREMIERLRDKLPGIQTPMMNGDNLAITLCSHFDNPNQPEDEFGWSKDAVRGQYEVLDAIHAHYAATIASLSEALAEAEKKRAEDWQPIETAPKDGTEVLLFGAYPENDDGHPTLRVTAGFWCAPDPPVIGDCGGECRCPEYGEPEEPFWCSMHGGSDSGWMSTDGGFTTEWPPTHWRPLPAPPRDLSQGGQHG